MIEQLKNEVRAELEATVNERVKGLFETKIAAATDRVAGLNQSLEQAESEKAALVAEFEAAFPAEVQEVAAEEVTEEVQG
jgi:hypothetical protein